MHFLVLFFNLAINDNDQLTIRTMIDFRKYTKVYGSYHHNQAR